MNVWIWAFRLFVVAAAPLLAYYQIAATSRSLAIGILVGVAIVVLEMLASGTHILGLITAVLGAAVGIIVAKLTDYTVYQIGNDILYRIWDRYAVLRYFAFAALGLVIAVRKLPEIEDLDKDILKLGKRRGANLKVMDTSAIIDGRIADICETHFLSGSLIVPRFVLDELHHLGDSADNMKRARGRRGLDILARLQENAGIAVKIIDKQVSEVPDTDGKVVRLARELGAKVVTTDFNLNKIAALEGVVCLNVNDLSAALKPIVLPGEIMSVFVMKEGKEREQGVGYLDDGTMVVVEDGRKFIGKKIDLVVTSILQTSAGRMVFGRSKGGAPEKEIVG